MQMHIYLHIHIHPAGRGVAPPALQNWQPLQCFRFFKVDFGSAPRWFVFCHERVEPCSSLIFVAFSELSAVVPYFLPVLFRPSLYACPGSWCSPNTFANHVIQCRIEHSRPFVGHPKPGSMLSVKKFYRRWTDGNKKSAQMTSKQQSLHVFGTRRRIHIHRHMIRYYIHMHMRICMYICIYVYIYPYINKDTHVYDYAQL
jgi:hypothetical protein